MGEQVTDQDIVNSTLNETVTRVTKVSASFEGMSIAYASLFIMAVVPIFIGSRRSLSHHQRHKGEKTDIVTGRDAAMFPFIASGTLLAIYVAFKIVSKDYINLLLMFYFFFLGVLALAHIVRPVVERLVPLCFRNHDYHLILTEGKGSDKKDMISYEFDRKDVLCLGISTLAGVWYLWKKYWLANNLFGLAFAINGVELLSLNRISTGCILLSGLFIYDIFWVFATDVMVTVAKSFEAPIKLVFPQDLLENGLAAKNFAMLGLGDIVIPGIFIALLLRFDHSLKAKSQTYFYSGFVAYCLGLAVTILVMHYFKHAQPALLYLVPACIGIPVMLALIKGEVMAMFNYQDRDLVSDHQEPPLSPATEDDDLLVEFEDDNIVSERAKYDQMFEGLCPVNGLLSGDKAKPVLMQSNVPVDVLGKIWDLSDMDQDGCLDKEEFSVAMFLVHHSQDGAPMPAVLPPGLVPPSRRRVPPASLPGAFSILPTVPTPAPVRPGLSLPDTSRAVFSPWVITPALKAEFDPIFHQLDGDHDGYVTGPEVCDTMLKTGLSTNLLAVVWSLCDANSTGILNVEQFSLAMFLAQQTLKGIDLPGSLPPEMVPPSFRSVNVDHAAFGVRDAGPCSQMAGFSASIEIDAMMEEIENIKSDKLQAEQENLQLEADVRLRQGEVTCLQKEFSSVIGTLTQLESQKTEAQKLLDELNDKKSRLERDLDDLSDRASKEHMEVNRLKFQISNQEKLVKNQEKGIAGLQKELQVLREEENQLEQQMDSSKGQLSQLITSHNYLATHVTQTKQKVKELQQQYRELSGEEPPGYVSSKADNDGEMTNDVVVTGTIKVSSDDINNGFSNFGCSQSLDPLRDTFSVSPSQDIVIFARDPFLDEDPFKNSDPFSATDTFTSELFAAEDMFKDAFTPKSTGAVRAGMVSDGLAFDVDPFATIPPISHQLSPFPTSTTPDKRKKKPPPPRPAPPKGKSPSRSRPVLGEPAIPGGGGGGGQQRFPF